MQRINLTHRLAIPAVLVLVTLYMAVTNYPTMPEQIPTHFNTAGIPDTWGAKSFSGVFSLPFLQITLYGILSGLTLVFTRRKDIRDIINIPNRDKLSTEQLEKVRAIIVDGMTVLNLQASTMLFYIQLGMVQVVRGNWSGIGPFVWLFTVIIVATCAWMLYRIYIIRKAVA
ncbi:DUF1648 domain-containing protein [Desulforamulus aquiferis]|uniref:DUF1648 domain-containing protein n=1 Tax=Desulforamulus aquiferis TaxID=1397668 RepID=A0AAW7ZJ17_9FIRM|nr:DUF1648 domain-containing protein [Desulforamulus aquiferis]MDO7788969.1 DUF1648 domain-containing protein [Desulforamulus aquiferis]